MIQGIVQSLRKDRTGFKMNEQWYMLGQGAQCPNKGDTIQTQVVGMNGRDEYVGPITVTQKSQYSGSGGGGNKGGGRGGFDSVGQQVGNCITNATSLVCHGIVKVPEGGDVASVIQQLAGALMLAGDQVKANHAANPAGQAAPPQGYQPAPQAQPQPQPPQQGYPPPQAQSNTAPQQPLPGVVGPSYEDFDDDIPFS